MPKVNNSGIDPVEYKVLIEPEVIEETSKGGIVLATVTTERDKMAQVKGRLVAIGGNAFEDWHGNVPAIDQNVYFAKYAGYIIKGADGKDYRLANDKDVSAIVTV
jgi:co-chaperonin GroES (HSP10)